MAQKRIKLPAFDPEVVVELPDGNDSTREFKLRPSTQEVQDAVSEATLAAFRVLSDDESKPRDVIEAELAELDAVLEPRNGQKTMPSELLLKGYDAQTVTGPQIEVLIREVRAAARPS